jgi:hypothetical protein
MESDLFFFKCRVCVEVALSPSGLVLSVIEIAVSWSSRTSPYLPVFSSVELSVSVEKTTCTSKRYFILIGEGVAVLELIRVIESAPYEAAAQGSYPLVSTFFSLNRLIIMLVSIEIILRVINVFN